MSRALLYTGEKTMNTLNITYFESSQKPMWATQNAFLRHMWLAGRVFETPAINKDYCLYEIFQASACSTFTNLQMM